MIDKENLLCLGTVAVLGALLVLGMVFIPYFVIRFLEMQLVDVQWTSNIVDEKLKVEISPTILYKPLIVISFLSICAGMLYSFAVIGIARHWR